MSLVPITKVAAGQSEGSSVIAEVKEFAERIRRRALEFSHLHESADGQQISDWLRAERDLAMASEAELIEKDETYKLRIALPGLTEKEIEVTALPESLIVRGETKHTHEKDEGTVHFCEFTEKKLCRRFDLPEAIDMDHVEAHFDKGILSVVAKKMAQEPKTPVANG